ncbi:cbb3-type cytochrome c oxidase subunit 3 [Rhodocaloribacter sp.]|jgi:cbb3-type cytochrome oxidase subunit 3
MMKELAQSMETGILAEVGLIAFMFAFALILIRVMTMKKHERDDAKNMPLNDPREIVFPTNHE